MFFSVTVRVTVPPLSTVAADGVTVTAVFGLMTVTFADACSVGNCGAVTSSPVASVPCPVAVKVVSPVNAALVTVHVHVSGVAPSFNTPSLLASPPVKLAEADSGPRKRSGSVSSSSARRAISTMSKASTSGPWAGPGSSAGSLPPGPHPAAAPGSAGFAARASARSRERLKGSPMKKRLSAFLAGTSRAGASAVPLFDSWAGALTPGHYAAPALPLIFAGAYLILISLPLNSVSDVFRAIEDFYNGVRTDVSSGDLSIFFTVGSVILVIVGIAFGLDLARKTPGSDLLLQSFSFVLGALWWCILAVLVFEGGKTLTAYFKHGRVPRHVVAVAGTFVALGLLVLAAVQGLQAIVGEYTSVVSLVLIYLSIAIAVLLVVATGLSYRTRGEAPVEDGWRH